MAKSKKPMTDVAKAGKDAKPVFGPGKKPKK